jgi:hypothetical protein
MIVADKFNVAGTTRIYLLNSVMFDVIIGFSHAKDLGN